MTVVVKVAPQGVLVPHPLLVPWGDVQEVEIKQHARSIVIQPKARRVSPAHARIVDEMKAAGLVENVPWMPPPVVSAEERARLAEKLSQGQPLSEIIIVDREERT